MALFHLFKKNRSKEQPIVSPKPAVKQENIQPVNAPEQPRNHAQFSKDDIDQIVCEAIDKNGLDGLSKEEAELSKEFFCTLFHFYHENAVKNDHSSHCHRNGCDLNSNRPVFLTTSRVLCCNCALQYILGNLHNWHYYLGDLAAGIGAVPAYLQTKGKELQKQISELRKQSLFARLSDMPDEDIYQFVVDTDNDADMRAEAVLKMKNIELVNRIALETTTYPVMLSTLDFPLPKETVLHLSNQTRNSVWSNKVRTKALKKLEEADLKE